MIDAGLLDMYDAAALAGGVERAVDTAVVALVESGRVRVQRAGQLAVVASVHHHEVEAAVLDGIGTHGGRTIATVRIRATQDQRLLRIVDRLVHDGLLARARAWRLGGRLSRHGRGLAPTASGRRALAQMRADPPAWARTTELNAGRVALHGIAQMTDPQLSGAVFGSPAPTSGRRRGSGSWFGSAAGMGCGTGGGHGGGASCGGGCGGGGCGGGN